MPRDSELLPYELITPGITPRSEFVRGYREKNFKATEAPPGSPEKIRVLADRLSRRLPLWHPEDNATCERTRHLAG